METSNKNFESLVESIGQLMAMEEEGNDHKAAGLYRAMFRHETDLDKLDHNYADHILSYASCGCENAIEDYKNYLQYIKTLYPSEYLEYAKMLEDALKTDEKENKDEP